VPRRRLSTKRLLGIDRSGPNPVATRPDQPLRPFTIPNAIGLIRLGLIPVFLAIALARSSGRDTPAAVIFAVVAWADYLDGFTARLTGQFSRLGALLDPIIDRLLVISGMAVAWRFGLLPRWALALVIARELVMLGLSRLALRSGVEIKINWAGRLGVAPTMAAPFFALLGVHWLAVTLLYLGLALGLTATGFYMRRGLEHLAKQRAKLSSSD
jgi:cardiolipin synthase